MTTSPTEPPARPDQLRRRVMLALPPGLALLAAGLPAWAQADLSAEEISSLAREAFIWGYPIIDQYAVLHAQALDPSSPDYKGPLNTVNHARAPAGPEDRAVIAPNVDTPYSWAWLDLRAEPQVLTLPSFEPERYVSIQLIDAYTYILGYVTPRTNGQAGGDFLVAGPGWSGKAPEGIKEVFRSPTNLVVALYRTQILGENDLPAVHVLQDRYQVRPLSKFIGAASPPPAAPFEPIPPVDIRKDPFSMQGFRVLNWMLDTMPVLPEEADLRARLARVGIGPGLPFEPDSATEAALQAGMATALAEIQARAGAATSSAELFGSREFLGQDYLVRAAAAFIGIWGNAAEEFLGVGYHADSEGQPFDGQHRYTITFPPGGLPEVGAFWSITVYDQDRYVYANEIDRYSISSPMLPDLARDDDGGITIHVQHDRPESGREANWLPVPATPFGLTFRTYLPGAAIRDGSWQAPPVVRLP